MHEDQGRPRTSHQPVELRALEHGLQLASPVPTRYATYHRTDNLLVVAERGELRGFGEAAPFEAVTGEAPQMTRARLEAWLEDWDPLLPGRLHPRQFAGLTPSTRNAVEGALLDLLAREAGVPLASFLAGLDLSRHSVPTSLTLPLVPDDELVARTEKAVAQGYEVLKINAGLDPERDLHRARLVRDAAGPGVHLRVDANQGWDLEEAADVLPGLAALRLEFVEQPLEASDLQGHAQLRSCSPVPIMLDESVGSLAEAMTALEHGACDLINLKLQACGGPLEAMAIADRAEEHGVGCMVGCLFESRVSILLSLHVAMAHENIWYTDLDGATFLADDPVHGGATIEAGRLEIDPQPGLGIEAVAPAGGPLVAARRDRGPAAGA